MRVGYYRNIIANWLMGMLAFMAVSRIQSQNTPNSPPVGIVLNKVINICHMSADRKTTERFGLRMYT